MSTPIQEAKRALRAQVSAAVRQISAEARAAASARAGALLKAQSAWSAARSILFYAPMAGELDVWPLLTEALAGGKQILLPRFVSASRSYEVCSIGNLETDLRAGHFGIREPASTRPRSVLDRLDLILVPGVAFDHHGRRLGRGKGYYDQLLATIRGVTCGVAFDEQIVEEIPVEPHDVHLDCIVTPSRWVKVKP